MAAFGVPGCPLTPDPSPTRGEGGEGAEEPRFPFSPRGRRWREAPDEGGRGTVFASTGAQFFQSSWPGLTRPASRAFRARGGAVWIPGSSPGMTRGEMGAWARAVCGGALRLDSGNECRNDIGVWGAILPQPGSSLRRPSSPRDRGGISGWAPAFAGAAKAESALAAGAHTLSSSWPGLTVPSAVFPPRRREAWVSSPLCAGAASRVLGSSPRTTKGESGAEARVTCGGAFRLDSGNECRNDVGVCGAILPRFGSSPRRASSPRDRGGISGWAPAFAGAAKAGSALATGAHSLSSSWPGLTPPSSRAFHARGGLS